MVTTATRIRTAPHPSPGPIILRAHPKIGGKKEIENKKHKSIFMVCFNLFQFLEYNLPKFAPVMLISFLVPNASGILDAQ